MADQGLNKQDLWDALSLPEAKQDCTICIHNKSFVEIEFKRSWRTWFHKKAYKVEPFMDSYEKCPFSSDCSAEHRNTDWGFWHTTYYYGPDMYELDVKAHKLKTEGKL